MEVGRTDIVGKHIGQIEQKTKKVNQETMGAVLFIDEVYCLAPDNQNGNDLGTEKEMKDHREELLVVFAGYTEEIKRYSS